MGRNQFINNAKLSQAKRDIEKIIAQEVSYEIEAGFERIIKAFYDDYDPVVYDRTESTYLASSNFNDLSHIEGNNRGGIVVDSSNIPGQPYYNHWGKNKGKPMNTAWVFNRTYNGIHGLTRRNYFSLMKGEYAQKLKKKAERLHKMRDKKARTTTHFNRPQYFLEKYFKSGYYQAINDDGTISKIPYSEKAYFRMTPSPYRMMTDTFKNFRKGNGKMRPDSKDSHTISEISEIAITEYLKKHPIF